MQTDTMKETIIYWPNPVREHPSISSYDPVITILHELVIHHQKSYFFVTVTS